MIANFSISYSAVNEMALSTSSWRYCKICPLIILCFPIPVLTKEVLSRERLVEGAEDPAREYDRRVRGRG